MMFRCEGSDRIYRLNRPKRGHRRTKRTISIKIMKKGAKAGMVPPDTGAIVRLLYAYEP